MKNYLIFAGGNLFFHQSMKCSVIILLSLFVLSCRKDSGEKNTSVNKRVNQILVSESNGMYILKRSLVYSGSRLSEVHTFTSNPTTHQLEENYRDLFEYVSDDSALSNSFYRESSGEWNYSWRKFYKFSAGEVIHSESNLFQSGEWVLAWKWDRTYGPFGIQSESVEQYKNNTHYPYRNDEFSYDSSRLTKVVSYAKGIEAWGEDYQYYFIYEDGKLKQFISTPKINHAGGYKTLREYSYQNGKVVATQEFLMNTNGEWEDAQHTFVFSYDNDGYLIEWSESQAGTAMTVSITYETGEGNFSQMAEASTDTWMIYHTLPQPE